MNTCTRFDTDKPADIDRLFLTPVVWDAEGPDHFADMEALFLPAKTPK